MGIKIRKVLVLVFCFSSAISFSQKLNQKLEKKLAIANEKYDEFAFVKAGRLYEQLIESGYESKEIYARLGDTYFFNSDYSNALKWYSKMMEWSIYTSPEYYHRYTVSFRANDNSQGLSVMKANYDKASNTADAKKWDKIEYLKAIELQSDRYAVLEEAGINSIYSDFGIALVPNEEAIKQVLEIAKFEKEEKARIIRENAQKRRKDDNSGVVERSKGSNKSKVENEKKKDSIKSLGGTISNNKINLFEKLPKYKEVLFASAKDSGTFIKRKHNWNEKPYLKLYSAQIGEDGKLQNEKKLLGEINSKFHQSTPIITNDGLTMYFTRLVPYDKIKNKTAVAGLKLFQAQKENNKWVKIKELPYPINMEGTSSGHPALSPDNNELYFVSNRNKNRYDTDLYVVSRKEGGGFSNKVESLGGEINTYGRETFPFVDNSGILYFSSDGHPGLGGLDVFAAVKNNEGKYTVVNVGKPINSSSDDFAYVIDRDSKKGFFSSNRIGGKGDDDVYQFLELKPVVFPFKVNPVYSGTVKDSITGKPLRDVEITIYNNLNEKVETVTTDGLGKYSLDLLPLKDYNFEFKKEGFGVERIAVAGHKISENIELPIALFNEFSVMVDDKVVTLKEGDDLTNKLKLSPIYFDYGGYAIRKSSKLELDKIIDILKSRPNISIQVKSHTDSRGKDDYNLRLSKNRAKTTMDYIILEGGISKDRVWGDGYGESQLINNCSNGVKCSEAEHELNRRSEFIIVIK